MAWSGRWFSGCLLVVLGWSSAGFILSANTKAGESANFTVVVMDPLAAPLACDCVQGYAQRKYELLGKHLQTHLGRPVKVVWSESLHEALVDKTNGKVDLIIGKHSVVLADAKEVQLKVQPIASLTGKDGSTDQTGLIVARKDDPARELGDLQGYRVFFGTADCDEKHAAPMDLLKKHGITIPNPLETKGACSDACATMLKLKPKVKVVAVISSYAEPLLEGCGTIKKGDLRVLGKTMPVPFITAFVPETMTASTRAKCIETLVNVGDHPELLVGLETADGFVPYVPAKEKSKEKKTP